MIYGNSIILSSHMPSDVLPIGGKIFYIHSDNGTNYTFWNSSGQKLNTQTIEGLIDAAWYKIEGVPTADKFYVLNTSVGINGLAVGLKWSNEMATIRGTKNYNYIGGGKPATALVLPSLGDTSGTIWYWLKNTVNVAGNSTGCTDWFIGSSPNTTSGDDSNTELGKFRNAITTYPSIFANQSTWFSSEDTSQSIWSSIEDSTSSARGAVTWYSSAPSYRHWFSAKKTMVFAVCAIRSF